MFTVRVRFTSGGKFWPVAEGIGYMRALRVAFEYEGRGYESEVVPW